MQKIKLLYIGLIFLIWVITYITCQFIIEQKLGWDEVTYMAVAKGIASDSDFSARTYTIMGLLKYGYPSHLINFPIFPIYLSIFFKLFGETIQVAYFASWLSALGTCLLIYFIFLLFYKDSYLLAFFVSLSYLFCPGILKNCGSAMMEQFGCFLICLFTYLIFKDYFKGRFNYITLFKISLSLLFLWLYKSLYIGFIFGALIFILFAYNSKLSGKKLNTKIPLFLFAPLSYGLFAVLFYVLKKFIFLPVAPMMSFSQEQEINQTYTDFLGGFFNNFSGNLLSNLHYFFTKTLGAYFIYPSLYNYETYGPELLKLTGYYFFLGIYFFLLLVMLIIVISSWKKLSPEIRVFVAFVLTSIISFNLIFNVLFRSNNSNIWRYNVYYLPLYLCALWLIIKSHFNYLLPFKNDYPKTSKLLLILFLLFVYVPNFLSSISQYLNYEQWFHNEAKKNAALVKTIIKDSFPKFIYFNNGTHTTFVSYPTKLVIKDTTNEQLLQINKILSEPIEFLFLSPSDWLYKLNKDLILEKSPILNKYMFYASVMEPELVVYKFRKGTD